MKFITYAVALLLANTSAQQIPEDDDLLEVELFQSKEAT